GVAQGPLFSNASGASFSSLQASSSSCTDETQNEHHHELQVIVYSMSMLRIVLSSLNPKCHIIVIEPRSYQVSGLIAVHPPIPPSPSKLREPPPVVPAQEEARQSLAPPRQALPEL